MEKTILLSLSSTLSSRSNRIPKTKNAASFISSVKFELAQQPDLSKTNQILVKSIHEYKIL